MTSCNVLKISRHRKGQFYVLGGGVGWCYEMKVFAVTGLGFKLFEDPST